MANHILKLSNVTELKESQLQQSPQDVLTQLRVKYQHQLIVFIDRLSDVDNPSNPPEPPSTELTRALATLHHICSTKKQELLKAVRLALILVHTAFIALFLSLQPFDTVNTLVAVTDLISEHKKKYSAN